MFSDPKLNIEQCDIQPGMDIADLGSGSGFYTFAAAKALISTGRVYAVDTQKDLLTKLKNHATRDNLYNVEVVWGDIEKLGGTHLLEGSISLALVCNVLFQLENKKDTIQEIKRILIPGGKVLVVDWTDSFGGIGPAKDMIFTKEAALDIFQKGGFSLEKEISAGSHHFGLIFKKM